MALQYDGSATDYTTDTSRDGTISLEAMLSFDTHYCCMSIFSDEEDIIVIW